MLKGLLNACRALLGLLSGGARKRRAGMTARAVAASDVAEAAEAASDLAPAKFAAALRTMADTPPPDTGPDTGPADTGPAAGPEDAAAAEPDHDGASGAPPAAADSDPRPADPAEAAPATVDPALADTGPVATGPVDTAAVETAPAQSGAAESGPAVTTPAGTVAAGHAAPAAVVGPPPGTVNPSTGPNNPTTLKRRERKAMASGFDMRAGIAELSQRILEPVAGRLTAQQLHDVTAVTREVFEQLDAGTTVPEPGFGAVACGIIEPVHDSLTDREYRRAVGRLAGAMAAFCQGQRAA